MKEVIMKFQSIVFSLFATVLVFAFSNNASAYPADSGAGKTTCQFQGQNIRVCRALESTNGNYAVLDINYHGPLTNQVKVWVRVNYQNGARTGTFDLMNNTQAIITGGCQVETTAGCQYSGSSQMRDLMAFAQTSDGVLNALSLDIAFVDAGGTWDNNGSNGGTYHFDFPQL